MTFHLQSFWLSCIGVTGIMLSFPFAYFIYYFIFGIAYFDLLSAMIVFVLLGVGADDIFVFTGMYQLLYFCLVTQNTVGVQRLTSTTKKECLFGFIFFCCLVDAWHQSVHFVKDPNDHVERMTFTYRRASNAMLVTQTTTFFAFLATAFSRLLPVAAFGIWAGMSLCDFLDTSGPPCMWVCIED